MSKAKDISEIITDANFGGTLDVTGAITGTTATLTGNLVAPSLNGGQFAVNNMIINGSMAINQRGATSGVTSGYFVDRFSLSGCSASAVITSSTPTQFPTAITISATSGNPIVTQKIESKNVQHLSGKVVTVSFFAKNVSNATTLYVSLQYAGGADNWSSSTTISEQNLGNLTSDWVKYTASWTVPSGGLNGLQLNILCSGTSTFTMGVTGVMLQEGSISTPFEHRLFGEELALCQRYFYKSENTNSTYKRYSIMFVESTVNTRSKYPLPVPMRVHPALTKTGTLAIYNSVGGIINLTAISLNPVFTQNAGLGFRDVCIFAVVGSGLTAGTAGTLLSNNAAASLQFDAEL